MTSPVETVLLFVIIILTFLLLILGVQIYYILKEFRETVIKANKVLDDTGIITESVSEPVVMFSTFLTGIKTGSFFVNLLKKAIASYKEKGEKNGE